MSNIANNSAIPTSEGTADVETRPVGSFKYPEKAKQQIIDQLQLAIEAVRSDLVLDPADLGLLGFCLGAILLNDQLEVVEPRTNDEIVDFEPWFQFENGLANVVGEYPALFRAMGTTIEAASSSIKDHYDSWHSAMHSVGQWDDADENTRIKAQDESSVFTKETRE